MELTHTEDSLAFSGVAEDILSNDSDDSYDGNSTKDVDLDPTVFMGEGQQDNGEDELDEVDDWYEEEEGDIKCTIGKQRAKVCRARVNVNVFQDIFSIRNRMLQESNLAVKIHREKN